MKSFRMGGVHPPENKSGRGEPIAVFPLPQRVVIPLSQHIGAPAVAVVAPGDRVLAGQLIGRATGFVSANVHASLSGTVTAVDSVADADGVRRPAITIAREADTWMPDIDRSQTIVEKCTLSAREIVENIAEAGIVGLGGATFPTHVKLTVPQGRTVDMLIVNGAECEPYLTSDHRVMLDRGEEVLIGARIMARALGAERIRIAIENNKPDAIAHLKALAAKYGGMEVVALKTRYPQGGEKQLIDAVLSRRVPSGYLPIDVGVVVHNVGTALAVYQAVQKHQPLVERVVTVTGKGLARPANLLVRIGTPVSTLIEHCGGMPAGTGKIIAGGPMMGHAVANPDAPVTKGISGILLMEASEARREAAGECIRCARCVSVCPMGLEPYLLYKMARRLMWTAMQPHAPTDCIECGCCAYICPAHLPLLDYIRLGKAEVAQLVQARR